jgi:hypothetical protein
MLSCVSVSRPLVASIAIAAATTACGIGVAGLEATDGGSNPPGTEAGLAEGCKQENCTNGVDDDCNGLVDCEDPACASQGYACVAPPPGGWDFVAFAAGSQTACPAALTQTLVDVDPTSLSTPAVCTCTCEASGVSCESGNFNATGGTFTCPIASLSFSANGGQCTVQKLPVEPFVVATLVSASGGTCSPAIAKSLPPTGATQGEYCGGETAFGGGCEAGRVCALAPSGFQACIVHSGQLGCPGAGYASEHTVGNVQDGRGCSGCTCSGTPSATCGDGSWTFYASPNCTGTNVSVTVDGTCHQTGQDGNSTFQSTVYTASVVDAGCAPPTAGPSPTGSAQLTAPTTLCCP